jgi:ATP-dependent DNA ligase
MSIKLLEQVAALRGSTAKSALLATGLGQEVLVKYLRLAWESGTAFGTLPTVQVEDLAMQEQVPDEIYFREIVELAYELRGTNRNSATITRVDNQMRRGSARQAVWLERLLRRNLEIGVSHKSMEKYFGGDAPQRFRIRKCEAMEDQIFEDWVEETKYDGWRLFFKIEKGECQAYSSAGNVLGRYISATGEITGGCGLLARDLYELVQGAEVTFDTELVGASTREDAAVAARRTADASARAFVFDIFPTSFWQKDFQVSWRQRRRVLNNLFGRPDIPFLDDGPLGQWASLLQPARSVPVNVSLADFTIVKNREEAFKRASAKIAMGLEGIIVKDPSAPYTLGYDGRWLKVKGEIEEEFKIVDIVWKNKQPVLVVVLENETRVLVGGMTEEDWALIWTLPPGEQWRNSSGQKIDPKVAARGKMNPTYIGRWARVRYQQRTRNGSLAHPRFAGFRDMKSGGIS